MRGRKKKKRGRKTKEKNLDSFAKKI